MNRIQLHRRFRSTTKTLGDTPLIRAQSLVEFQAERRTIRRERVGVEMHGELPAGNADLSPVPVDDADAARTIELRKGCANMRLHFGTSLFRVPRPRTVSAVAGALLFLVVSFRAAKRSRGVCHAGRLFAAFIGRRIEDRRQEDDAAMYLVLRKSADSPGKGLAAETPRTSDESALRR